MLNDIGKIKTIAYYTAKEVIKSRILYNVLLLGISLLVVTYVAFSFTYGEASRVALDFGLGMLSISSVGIAIFIGVGLLSKEIENRTVYMIVSRPAPRYTFILGKILGLTCVLVLNILLLAALTLACYLTLGGELYPIISYAILFTIFESILVLLVVSLVSLVMSPTMSVLITIVIYISGHAIGEAKMTQFANHFPSLMKLLDFYQFVLPAFTKLNIKDYVLYKQTIGFDYIFSTLSYSVIYSMFLVLLSIIVFEKKNLD